MRLGLYDAGGRLHHVGVAASFKTEMRTALAAELAPLLEEAHQGHPWGEWIRSAQDPTRIPGGQSRWSQGKDLSWVPVRAERVAEVSYDHMQGSRFRHTSHFVRWREDKGPTECTFDQVDVVPPVELVQIFGVIGAAHPTKPRV